MFACFAWLLCPGFQEPWALRAHPELGFLTVIALGTEKTWLVVGTSRGFVMLWDLRFQARAWCCLCRMGVVNVVVVLGFAIAAAVVKTNLSFHVLQWSSCSLHRRE